MLKFPGMSCSHQPPPIPFWTALGVHGSVLLKIELKIGLLVISYLVPCLHKDAFRHMIACRGQPC